MIVGENEIFDLPEIGERLFILRSNDDESTQLFALGVEDEFILDPTGDLDELNSWIEQKRDWIFGYLSYDLKNKIENLQTNHPNNTGVHLAHFVCPKVVFETGISGITIHKEDSRLNRGFIHSWYEKIKSITSTTHHDGVELQPAQNKEEYLYAVGKLKQHIHGGDIYEINYCQEFSCRRKLNAPYATWLKLNKKTQAPFAAYFQLGQLHLMCGSPERFLKRTGTRVISQPIKGTIRRSAEPLMDQKLKDELHDSLKERTENVMIVDLVRNDLSRSAERGSVQVEKMFEPVTFKTVHHLVSTISASVKSEVSFIQLIRDTFPMGSMTGAPKIKAMELSDIYERSSRGIYSGSVGYIKPNGDFDFNVVIRSIVYNSGLSYISSHVGGAITAMCEPEKEYEECLLKIRAVVEALA